MMKKKVFLCGLILFSFWLTTRADAANISLNFPVKCQQGKTCYVNFDKKTNSTNVILNTQSEMLKGTNVLAADDGKVIKVVNNMPDADTAEQTHQTGDPCGNQVIIQHDNGWVTQYCHLKQGSIDVTPGQQVKNLQTIAQVGESGVTNFPKLGFMVLQNGVPRNPFNPNIWANKIPLNSYGLIDMGLTNQPITLEQASEKPEKKSSFNMQDKQIVAWVRVYGAQKGDQQKLTFYMPSGKVYAKPQESKITDNYPQWFYTAQFAIGTAIPPQYFGKWSVVYQYKRGNNPWKTLGKAEFNLGG